MKIVIDRGPLLRVLGHVQAVVERRATVPILANVLLDAERDTLTLTATDMDLQATENVPASVETPGRTTVSANTLYDIVRKLPDGSQVELKLESSQLIISAGRSRFRLSALPADDFPMIAVGELPTKIEMPAEELSRLLSKVRYAISTEETRYYLMGVYFHTHDNQLLAVTTDGHRLARCTGDKPGAGADIDGVIIPRKVVGEILKVIDDVDGNVTVEISPTKIRFTLGEAVYTSKLIDGTFPDYNRVIPQNNNKIVRVSASILAQSIDRVSTIVTERTRAVKMDLSHNKITLTVSSPEAGRAVEEIEAEYDGEDLEIGFNARYFLDVLNQQGKDQIIEIALDGPSSPAVIRPQNSTGDLSVLMPMRI